MKTCIETIRGLGYNLCMFGIPIMNDEPSYIFCNNESVVKNCSKVESILNKKCNSIAYHVARWVVTAREVVVGWVNTK